MRLALLCSGQGMQHPEMFDRFRADAGLAHLIDDWQLPVTGDIFANRHAQPLIVGAACAAWEALRARVPRPHVVAGYSVGEVAALAVAGMLSCAEAIALARVRARLMDACVEPARPQGMMAVSRLTIDALIPLLRSPVVGSDDVGSPEAEIAIVNADDQFIVGGSSYGLVTCSARLVAAGARVQVLPVTVASHTTWMYAAATGLREHMQTLPLAAPRMNLLAGVDAGSVTTAASAVDILSRQTTQTVRWSACMDAIAESGVTVALELGPGAALSRMLMARHPHIACRSVSEFRTLDGMVAWLGNP